MELATFDLYYLVKEWQELIEGRIQKIYTVGSTHVFHIYANKAQHALLFDSNIAHVTKANLAYPKKPSGWCTFLRKRLKGGRVRAIELLGFDRIVKISIETKEATYEVMVELFQKINVLVLKDGKIVSAFDPTTYNVRSLRGGVAYEPPPKRVEPWSAVIPQDKAAVKALAGDIGLGSKYATELCARLAIDPKAPIANAGAVQNAIIQLRDAKVVPRHSENDALPFPFVSIPNSDAWTACESYNSAIDAIEAPRRATAEAAESHAKASVHSTKQERIIEAQKKSAGKLEKQAATEQRAGEAIYENYQDLTKLLEVIRKDWRELSHDALIKKYEQHPIVKKIDKDGSVEVEL